MKRIITSTYKYDGPAYRFGKNIGNFKIETEAPTKGRAKSNILYRIKQELNLDRKQQLEIIDSRILLIQTNEVTTEVGDNSVEEPEQLCLF